VKVIVTGANGFIGLHTVKELLKRGYQVAAVDKEIDRVNKILSADLTVYKLDIVRDDLTTVIERGDKVIHLAAVSRFKPAQENPEMAFQVNVMGTLKIILACLEESAERLIYSSTGSVYAPDVNVPIVETARREPVSIYGLTKKMAEDLIFYFGKQYLRYVVLRYGYVYGPGKTWGAVGAFLELLREGKQPVIYGGSQINDFVYVKDVVNANLLALETPYVNQTYNIGTGRPMKILDVYDTCRRVLGSEIEPRILPPREFDYTLFVYDIRKAQTLLNYEPKWKLEDALRTYVEA